MLIDIIRDNPAEPPLKSRYRDPAVLAAYGYDAIVIPDALLALNTAAADAIDRRLRQAADIGMQVFFYADAFALPRQLVEADPKAYLCETSNSRKALCAAKPAVYQAFQQSIAAMFARWPGAAGLILRPSQSFAEAAPPFVAASMHESSCPACRGLNMVARYQKLIRAMYDTVVASLGKIYVHRTWHHASPGVPTMHDDPDLYRQVAADLPRSDRLVFSFRCTRGDYKAGQLWNPILLTDWEGNGDLRPKWVEFHDAPDGEGKGAFPNFQATRWSEFLAASNLLMDNPAANAPKPARTLAHPLGFPEPPAPKRILRPHIALWGWSRGGGGGEGAEGGGFGGPYIQREEWIDANVYALGQLYRDPTLTPRQLARSWAAKAFSIDPESAPADVLTDILLQSAATIHNLVSSSVPALADASWVHDDRLDIEALWAACARPLDAATVDAACDEKLAAFQAVEHMRRMFEHVTAELPNPAQARDLANTLTFYNSFAGTLAHAFCGFIRYMQWQRGGRTNAKFAALASDHLEHAQAHWQHHTQRHALLPGAPSVFHEDTLWERTNACLQDLAAAEA